MVEVTGEEQSPQLSSWGFALDRVTSMKSVSKSFDRGWTFGGSPCSTAQVTLTSESRMRIQAITACLTADPYNVDSASLVEIVAEDIGNRRRVSYSTIT